MPGWCWPSVVDGGPASIQHWFNVLHLLQSGIRWFAEMAEENTYSLYKCWANGWWRWTLSEVIAPGERCLSKNAWLWHIQWYNNIFEWRTINHSGTAIYFCIFFTIPYLPNSLDETLANSYVIGLRLQYMIIMLTVTFLMELTQKLIALFLLQISSSSSIMIYLPTACVSNNIKKVVWRCEIWSPDYGSFDGVLNDFSDICMPHPSRFDRILLISSHQGNMLSQVDETIIYSPWLVHTLH